MANSDKNIVITPSRGGSAQPSIVFTGNANVAMTMRVTDDNSLSFENLTGQLFSISNNLTSGTIFSVTDISGVPFFSVNASGNVALVPLGGANVGIGTSSPQSPLDVYGNIRLGNTATSFSGIRFPDGTFQNTNALPPSGQTVGTTATQTLTNKTLLTASLNGNIQEKITVSATAATGNINCDVLSQQILYYTTSSSANFNVNIRGDSTNTLNSLMDVGESLTTVFMATNGGTAYYNTIVRVDGSTITPRWQGGTAPTAGNASSVDVYSYMVVKTGASTFNVFASQTKFA